MNRTFAGTKIIFKKEMLDSLRDRRSLLTAMAPALLLPILMTFMFSTIAETRNTTDVLEVRVIGQENAPDLIRYLSERDISFESYDGNAKQDIQSGDIEVMLEIPDDYAEKFTASEPATVYLHSDNSMDKSDAAADRLRTLIRNYGGSIGSLRLVVRGINPAIASAVVVENADYSTDASRAGQILGAMQMFILMAAFFGSAPSAIDVTAGERERNSLEPLLIHPVSSLQIMLGKYFSVASFGLLASVLTVIITAVALSMVSLNSLGVDPKLTPSMQLNIILILMPMVLLAAAILMLLSLFSKTFKEAQSYTGMVMMLPMLAVMPTLMGVLKTADWMYFVPLLGQTQLLDRILRGDELELVNVALNAGITLVTTALILIVLVRNLRHERVVYGG